MHVDQSRHDVLSGGIDCLDTGRCGQPLADLLDDPVLHQHVQRCIHLLAGIDHPAALDQKIHMVTS